jgi:hypothetical protein
MRIVYVTLFVIVLLNFGKPCGLGIRAQQPTAPASLDAGGLAR